eukprot:1988780-Pleurochrysis_carterae.AAC.1
MTRNCCRSVSPDVSCKLVNSFVIITTPLYTTCPTWVCPSHRSLNSPRRSLPTPCTTLLASTTSSSTRIRPTTTTGQPKCHLVSRPPHSFNFSCTLHLPSMHGRKNIRPPSAGRVDKRRGVKRQPRTSAQAFRKQ